MTVAQAPGKIILFGEHAVVYGRPAIAVPLALVQARAEVEDLPDAQRGRVRIEAPDVGISRWLHDCPDDDPIGRAVRLTLDELADHDRPAMRITVTSDIPIAGGLGSGAAVSVAVIRALSTHAGKPMTQERQSALAFEVEKLHHGTPSGIDNTVVTYNQPVFFTKGEAPQRFRIGRPFGLAIGVSDMPSPTAAAVLMVRQGWLEQADRFDELFDAIGEITRGARRAIEEGRPEDLGPMMNKNQQLLEELGVSSAVLREMIDAARDAGALGAKLSGAGLGGNVIALVDDSTRERVLQAFDAAGAVRTLATEVQP